MELSSHALAANDHFPDHIFRAITPDGQHCAHCGSSLVWEAVNLVCPQCGVLLQADFFPVNQAPPPVYRVYLLSSGAQRLALIATLHTSLQISLQTARAIVNSERPLLLEGLSDEVEPLVHALQALGATTVIE